MADFSFGHEAKMYYAVGGQGGSWLELTVPKDVTLNLGGDEADVSHRGSEWVLTALASKDASIDWDMIWDSGNAGFTAIKNAYINNTMIGLRILDKDGEGLQGDFAIMSFNRSEPLREALSVSITAKPTYTAGAAPSWIGG